MPSIAEAEQFQGLENFWNLLVYLLSSRTICRLEDGRLILAPNFAKPGNVLAILAGCSSPVILREEADGTMSLVGDAYALGQSSLAMRTDFVTISLS